MCTTAWMKLSAQIHGCPWLRDWVNSRWIGGSGLIPQSLLIPPEFYGPSELLTAMEAEFALSAELGWYLGFRVFEPSSPQHPWLTLNAGTTRALMMSYHLGLTGHLHLP